MRVVSHLSYLIANTAGDGYFLCSSKYLFGGLGSYPFGYYWIGDISIQPAVPLILQPGISSQVLSINEPAKPAPDSIAQHAYIYPSPIFRLECVGRSDSVRLITRSLVWKAGCFPCRYIHSRI